MYKDKNTVGFIDFYHGPFEVEFPYIFSDCIYSKEFKGKDSIHKRMEGFNNDLEDAPKYFAIAIKAIYERLEYESRTRKNRSSEECWGLFLNTINSSFRYRIRSDIEKIKAETLNMTESETRSYLKNKSLDKQDSYSYFISWGIYNMQYIFGWGGLVRALGINALRVYFEDNAHNKQKVNLFPYSEFMNIETESIYANLLSERAKDEYPLFEEILMNRNLSENEVLSKLQKAGLF